MALAANDPIEIVQVANGFKVRPARLGQGMVYPEAEERVFQSMNELITYLLTHFSHRNASVASDD